MNFVNIAVKQLHREFLRAGADVMQAFTFYASDDKLQNRGNEASEKLTVGYIRLLSIRAYDVSSLCQTSICLSLCGVPYHYVVCLIII